MPHHVDTGSLRSLLDRLKVPALDALDHLIGSATSGFDAVRRREVCTGSDWIARLQHHAHSLGMQLIDWQVDWSSSTAEQALAYQAQQRALEAELTAKRTLDAIERADAEARTGEEAASEERLSELEAQRVQARATLQIAKLEAAMAIERADDRVRTESEIEREERRLRRERIAKEIRELAQAEEAAIRQREVSAAESKRRIAEEEAKLAEVESSRVLSGERQISEVERLRRERLEAQKDLQRRQEWLDKQHQLKLAWLSGDRQREQKLTEEIFELRASSKEMLALLASLIAKLPPQTAYLSMTSPGTTAPSALVDQLGLPKSLVSLHHLLESRAQANDRLRISHRSTRLAHSYTRDINANFRAITPGDELAVQLGDPLEVSVTSDERGNLTLIDFGTSGRVWLLIPNRVPGSESTPIAAGQTITLPGDPFLPQRLIGPMRVTGQPGRERVVAIVTPTPIAHGLGRYAETSVFAELHEQDLAELERRLRELGSGSVGMVDFWVK